MSRIFVSYKRKNKKQVLGIVKQIEAALNEKCFIDYNEIEANAYFMDIICKAIDESDVVLFMHSNLHNKIDYDNDWTIKEYRYAKEKNKNVVLVKLDNSKLDNVFLFEFGSRNYIDSQDQDQVNKLIKDIAKWLKVKVVKREEQPIQPQQPQPAPNPRLAPKHAPRFPYKWLLAIAVMGLVIYFIYRQEPQKTEEIKTTTVNEPAVEFDEKDTGDVVIIPVEPAVAVPSKPQPAPSKPAAAETLIKTVIPSSATGKVNGHEYVDLGLSVLWATCNVGAESTEKGGSFFAWGETENKAMFTPNSYRWMEDGAITKYTNEGKEVLDMADDVAGIKWGAGWHIPSQDDVNELIDKCRWDWKTINGTEGYLITSKEPGFENRSIFLPVAGKREGNSTGSKTNGYYWTCTKSGTPSLADLLYFDSKSKRVYADSRYVGRLVRPVCDKE